MQIAIGEIWLTQKMFKRADSIPHMMETLLDGKELPPVTLNRLPDDSIEVQDGHHRVMAYYLAGFEYLEDSEFILIDKDQPKRRYGQYASYSLNK